MSSAITLTDIKASVTDKEILKGVDLRIPFGEVHALMGPNGSGKSTLCHVISGKSGYESSGSVNLDGTELSQLTVDERARQGLLQAFQYPTTIPGVHLDEFLLESATEFGLDPTEAKQRIERSSATFDMDRFLDRAINDGLSGGEKKRSEIFQISVLKPKVAVLDEIDSGLDIDAVKQVAAAVEALRSPDVAILIITHYSRILRFLSVDRIHVMIDGRIVESGGSEVAEELEAGGYDAIKERHQT